MKKVLLFSPIRTGSTLIMNIIRDYFYKDLKHTVHKLSELDNIENYTLISTVRSPYDSIISSIKRYNLEINDKHIKSNIIEFKKYGGDDIVTLIKKDYNNHLILKYEDFYNNFDFLINKLEIFFNTELTEIQKQEIKTKYHINNIDKISKNLGTNFWNYDKNTHWHGNHISNTKGNSTYKETLTNRQKNIIFCELKEYIELFNY